jgi:predicted O-linked N-acetylglucosamine transferase (SPINDLY family)
MRKPDVEARRTSGLRIDACLLTPTRYSMPTVAEAFNIAVQHHQAGNLPVAEQLYRQIVLADPNHADAHHLLGVLACQTGHFDHAVASIRRAVALNSWAASYHCNLGIAYNALGQFEEAAASFRQALGLEPNQAETHNNLANTLARSGQAEEAIAHYQQALQIRPDYAEAENGLASAYLAHGGVEEAIHHYRQALRIRPGYLEARTNLAGILQAQGKLTEAIEHCREVLQARPNFAEAQYALACALHSGGKLNEAVAHHQEALRLRPDFAEAHNGLANALAAQGELEAAIEYFQQALRLKPDFAFAHNNLGDTLMQQGRPELALPYFRQALHLQPELRAAQSNVLFCLNYDPEVDLDVVFAEHCKWGQMLEGRRSAECAGKINSDAFAACPSRLDSERRLRIGYLSPDFRLHPITRYFEPVLEHHDSCQVEVYCYAEVPRPDAVTERLQKLVQGWHCTCYQSDADVAQRIREDGIDILVDLAGHTANNRLRVLALKPAPIQATWLGYLNTTGLTSVDFRITDNVLNPPSQPRRDTEELERLPNGMCCFAPPEDAPAVEPLPALKAGCVTFGSLHSLFKINVKVIDLWSAVLSAVPGSRMLMFHHSIKGSSAARVRKEFVARGIDNKRLDLRKGSNEPGYLAVLGEIDICLDTFPVTGGVTTCESLWMGVPVLTLCGVRPVARNSASMLTRVGLSDWIAHSREEYCDLAARFASDTANLSALRAELRERMDKSICDARRFTRQLEETYRTWWRRWCAAAELQDRP